MKKYKAAALLCVLLFIFSACKLRVEKKEDTSVLGRLEPYLTDGAVIDMAQVFPEKWDTLILSYDPMETYPEYSPQALLNLDPDFSMFHDHYFVILLYDQDELINFSAYPTSGNRMPLFQIPTTDKSGEKLWKYVKIDREDAVFECNMMETDSTERLVLTLKDGFYAPETEWRGYW